jgi:hypothetical protein
MNKKTGNNVPPSSLKGFEDVFEDYVISEEYRDSERRSRENSKISEQYELQHFLEQENSRLTGLEIFLTKKIALKTNFSQTEKIFQMQNARKKLLKEKFSVEFKKLDSVLQLNLSKLFNSHFS